MAVTDQLTGALGLMQIAGVANAVPAGQQITATLAPLPGALQLTEIVQQEVSLDLIAKQVVFTDTDFSDPGWLDDPQIAKILPMFNLAAGAIPVVDGSGVPGLVGRLKGMLPVPVSTEMVPTMTVQWLVTDDAGNTLVDGSDFLAPNGLANPTLAITFLPAFVPFDGTVPAAAAGRRLTARVTLSAGAVQVSRDVGPIRIEIPALPFPRVLALTVGQDFTGAALVMVPDAAGINSLDHIRSLLQPVRNAISTLTAIARLAEMLTGIDALTAILEATNVEFRRRDRIDNLNNVTLIQRPWYEINDIEAEDELSSFVYLAPPPPRESDENLVEMCNARNLSRRSGRFTVATGSAFVALCRNLHSATPAVTPADAVLTVTDPPPTFVFPVSYSLTFGDQLSSIRFL